MIENESTVSKTALKAPACFGSISCFSYDSEHCKHCPAYQACAVETQKTLESIKATINVDDLMRKHKKAKEKMQGKRDVERAKIETPASKPEPYGQPKLPDIVVRATKTEKVTFEITEQDNEIILKLPVKAQTFACTLIKSGMVNDVKQGLKDGRNAIDGKKPMWFSKSVGLLAQGGFTRAELREHLMSELSWGENSAGPHVSLAIAILTGFNLAKDDSGRIVALP